MTATPAERLARARLGGAILLARMSRWWLAPALCALLFVGLHGLVVPELERMARMARAQLDAATRQAAAPRTPDRARATQAARGAAFEQLLGAPDSQTRALRMLVDGAARHRITVAQGEYRQGGAGDSNIGNASGASRLEWSVPIRGNYPALRDWIEEALTQLPNVSLDDISLRRDNVAAGQIEARLRWSIWTRAAGAVTPSTPATVAGPAVAGPTATPATDVLLLEARPRAQLYAPRRQPARDLFAAHSWTPPPLVVKPPPPPPPRAPQLPYTYLGKKFEDGRWEAYLLRDTVAVIAREGATLDSVYRVESIRPPLLTLVYLPLAETQTLPIGNAD